LGRKNGFLIGRICRFFNLSGLDRIMFRFGLSFLLAAIASTSAIAQSPPPAGQATNTAKAARAAAKQKKPGREATGLTLGENKATPLNRIRALPGFRVELVYSVPASQQGSWVNLCVDDKGRIMASDQYGGLFRFKPPLTGQSLDPGKIERIPAEIRAANGLIWAFNALYVAVNDYEKQIDSGLYRITDSNGDDRLDKVELLRAMEARGDHGVHALLKTPDGKGLFLVTGDGTKPTAYSATRVPPMVAVPHTAASRTPVEARAAARRSGYGFWSTKPSMSTDSRPASFSWKLSRSSRSESRASTRSRK